MEMLDLITKKRDGEELSRGEISWFVREYTAGRIPDYQASAFLMAVYFKGMTDQEIFILSDEMMRSGDVMDLSGIPGKKADKHSTGGVGDKTTMAVVPIVAACGVPVAKMSGRGLGFSGGTIDKLESIPGFRTSLKEEDFENQVKKIGAAISGQTGVVAPADKKIYALRDVTGTVESKALIASSIMSKKLASGADVIVLDVKCGEGAFMKTPEDALELAELMCAIGKSAGRSMAAYITDMSQPLGLAVGNALEVREAYDVLNGRGPADTTELVERLAGMMLYLGGRARTEADGKYLAKQALAGGAALRKFREIVSAQGGDVTALDDPLGLPRAPLSELITAESAGFVQDVNAMKIGIASREAGAGREQKGDRIDPGAGILLEVKRGAQVRRGDVLAAVFSSDKKKIKRAANLVREAYRIGAAEPEPQDLILDTVLPDEEE